MEKLKSKVKFDLMPTEDGIRIVVKDKPWLSSDLKVPSETKTRLVELMHGACACKEDETETIHLYFFALSVLVLYLAFKDLELPMESLVAVIERLASGRFEKVSNEEVERIFNRKTSRRNQTSDGKRV